METNFTSEKREFNRNNPTNHQQPIPQQVPIQNNAYQIGVQQPYNQAALYQRGGQNAIVVNQPLQVQQILVTAANINWGTSPASTICQFCRNPITTNVEKIFNCGACFLCWFTGFVYFVCIQACLGKEIGCMDAVHRCPLCGNMVGVYHAI